MDRLQTKQVVSALVLIASLVLMAVSGYMALARHTVPLWYPPLAVPVAWFATRNYARQGDERLRLFRKSLRDWLDAWAEFEALTALAWYASEHPDDPFPKLEPNERVYEARGLAHPLLAESTTIRKDVHLSQGGTYFYVISGSNMSGKSTLLRAIGLNAVLAFAGAPVRAFRSSIPSRTANRNSSPRSNGSARFCVCPRSSRPYCS